MPTQTRKTVRIRGPDGRAKVYAIERIARRCCLWAARLTAVRKSEKPARTYTVACDDINGWRCDCPSATIGSARKGGYSCKHAVRAAALAAKEGINVMAKQKPPAPSEGELLRLRLHNPFPATEVKWKPQATSGDKTKAMAVGYIDARAVMDRLDKVVGPMGWTARFFPRDDGNVVCQLSLRDGDVWVTKEDVGNPSEQPDAGDKLKAAFSDALKRAAVHWGIGRYLYHLPHAWMPYDHQRRRLLQTPPLPTWALPQDLAAFEEPPPPEDVPPAPEDPAKAPAPQPVAETTPAEKPKTLADGVRAYDAKLAGERLCQPGELFDHVKRTIAGKHGEPEVWTGEATKRAAWAAAQHFEKSRRDQSAA